MFCSFCGVVFKMEIQEEASGCSPIAAGRLKTQMCCACSGLKQQAACAIAVFVFMSAECYVSLERLSFFLDRETDICNYQPKTLFLHLFFVGTLPLCPFPPLHFRNESVAGKPSAAVSTLSLWVSTTF